MLNQPRESFSEERIGKNAKWKTETMENALEHPFPGHFLGHFSPGQGRGGFPFPPIFPPFRPFSIPCRPDMGLSRSVGKHFKSEKKHINIKKYPENPST